MKEDLLERQSFNRLVERLYGGKPLAAVAATLSMWSLTAPQSGSSWEISP